MMKKRQAALSHEEGIPVLYPMFVEFPGERDDVTEYDYSKNLTLHLSYFTDEIIINNKKEIRY